MARFTVNQIEKQWPNHPVVYVCGLTNPASQGDLFLKRESVRQQHGTVKGFTAIKGVSLRAIFILEPAREGMVGTEGIRIHLI